MGRKVWLVLVALCGGAAWAQAPGPAVMPYPLDVKRTPQGFAKKELTELQGELRRVLRKAEALVPDTARGQTALRDLKRQDCEREDACLQQLAQKAETLYAVYVSLDFTLEKKVVVSGRVVRDDGKLMGELRTVSVAKGQDAFKDVAKVALVQLVDALGVRGLPPVRPVEVVEPPKPEVKVDAPKPPVVEVVIKDAPPPPLPPPEVKTGASNDLKTTSYVLLGAGLAGVAVGTGLLVSAASDGSALGLKDGIIAGAPDAEGARAKLAASMQTKQVAGVVSMGVGVAAAATGVVLMLLPASGEPGKPVITVAPTQGGAMATATWELP